MSRPAPCGRARASAALCVGASPSFTRSKDNKTLYAIEMGWPSGNQMVITSLRSGSFDASTITSVTFIGGGACTYTQDSTGLKVTLPANGSSNANGYAVKISFSGTIPTPRQ